MQKADENYGFLSMTLISKTAPMKREMKREKTVF